MSDRPVADSTVLIYLARIGRLELLDELFDAVLVPEPVYEETVVRGREGGYRDALAIDGAFEDPLIRHPMTEELGSAAEQLETTAELGTGEAAAIALASHEGARCLTDDHGARTTAEAMGVAVGGTVFLLLLALEEGRLSLDRYLDAIDVLTDEGFRMDATLYREARAAGRRLEE